MRSRNPADQGFLRELNLSAVLRLIYTQAPLARAQLAKKTGLNKSTVSSLVEDLMLRKLVYETGTNSNTAGRPSTLLEINPKVGAVIAVELGVDFVAAALIDFAGKIHWRKQISADPAESQAETIGQTRALVAETLAISRERDLPVLALSFAIPGTVDLDAGVLIFAPNLNWRNVSFRTIFADSQLKIYVENDANAAAVGEHLFGAAQDAQDFVFVFAGVGLGGGLFLNDRLYRGKSGAAGEIGHTPIRQQPVQPECHCGNRGCWETYANQASIVSRIQARLDGPGREGSLIASLMEERRAPLSISMIKEAADAGDRAALAALADAGAAMGHGMAGLINILNPEKIILGGPVSVAGDHLLPSILETVQAQSMHGTEVQTEIKVSAFGPDASLIGAAAVVVDDILTYPTQVAKEVMAGTESVSVEAGI